MRLLQTHSKVARLGGDVPAQRQGLATLTNSLKETITDTNALLSELEPLLEPIVQAGDPTAKAVKEGYHTFCQSGTVLADSAMLIAQTEPMQLASIGEGGHDSNHLAIRLLEGKTVQRHSGVR